MDEMGDEQIDTSELEAELYSRIHHDEPVNIGNETIEAVTTTRANKNRIITKHSIFNIGNNNNHVKRIATKNRKKKSTKESHNPNPFAFAPALNNKTPMSIPKRLTPYTSYLSAIDSQPIPLHRNVKDKGEENDQRQRPNPFNRMNEEKIKRIESMRQQKRAVEQIGKKTEEITDLIEQKPYDMPDSIAVDSSSDSEDDVIIVPIPPPPIYDLDSSDEDNIPTETVEENSILHDTHDTMPCDFIHENYSEQRRHDGPFGGIDASELSEIVSSVDAVLRSNVEPMHNFAKPQRSNRQSVTKSYEVAENDFAQTDVYESENSDLPEGVYSKGKKISKIPSESDCGEMEVMNRSKRMRKRKSSGSNRGSDYISDDSDDEDVNDTFEKHVDRPCIFRGEAIHNAVTRKKTKQIDKSTERESDQEFVTLLSCIAPYDKSKEHSEDIEMDSSSGTDTEGEDTRNAQKESSNWLVKDQVGAPDDIEIDASILEEDFDHNETELNCEDKEINESNVGDKDDVNCVRSKPLVIHPEMGWNYEMKAFYNDSWGGETHDSIALRKQMPTGSIEWPIVQADRHANYNRLKAVVKCMNCRENGHRIQFCPQPRKEIVCYTCGYGGHRESRCPNSICLKCGAKTTSYSRNCNRCIRLSSVVCVKCRTRGHLQFDCPDNWRSFHNTIDNETSPRPLPTNARLKKFCSICAGTGHTAEYCYDALRLMGEDVPSTKVRKYEKVFKDNLPLIDNSNIEPYVMFESPRENYEFNWNVNESEDRFYGRFMTATKIEQKRMVKAVETKRKGHQAKRRRLNDNVVVEKSKEQLVLNPMNPKNKRNSDKPKKQFSKDFYTESITSMMSSKANEHNSLRDNVIAPESVTGTNVNDNVCSEESKAVENVDQHISSVENIDNDKTDIVPTTVPDLTQSGFEETIQANDDDAAMHETMETDELTAPIDETALLNEAIEVEKLHGLSTFSFATEMEKLENTKAVFDLSFIGSTSNVQVAKSVLETEVSQNEAEIQKLTEVEVTLNKLKKRLTTMSKPKDSIVLNISNSNEHSVNYDSDSNYSFGEYFDQSKLNEKHERVENNDTHLTLPEFIPLSSTRMESPVSDSMDNHTESGISHCLVTTISVSEAKIFLTKEHNRMLMTEAGNCFLHQSSAKYKVKVRMEWESVGNILVVVGTEVNQKEFHEDLVKYLEDMNKKVRLRNETFQLLPKSRVGLIRFIRQQFDLLEQPLGNVQELYNNMRVNENMKSKTGTKNADKTRKKLNIILMGRAGLRDGRQHLSGLENNLKFLLENTKDMMTKHFREEIFQHYRYIFSSYSHDDYPELISAYNDLKKSNNFPQINIDRRLLEIKICLKDDDSLPVDLDQAKRKLMLTKTEESPRRRSKLLKPETKSPKPQTKSPKISKSEPIIALGIENDIKSKDNQNLVWSLKCKEIVEKCRQIPHIQSSILEKFNVLMVKANKNELSYNDYVSLDRIANSLNQSVK